jgi:hypothetical protein
MATDSNGSDQLARRPLAADSVTYGVGDGSNQILLLAQAFPFGSSGLRGADPSRSVGYPTRSQAIVVVKELNTTGWPTPPPWGVSLKTKGIADPIFDSEGVRVAVFDLKELRCCEYLKDINLQMLYLFRHRNSGKVAVFSPFICLGVLLVVQPLQP